MSRKSLFVVLTLGLLLATLVAPAFAQGTTPPAGFCTIAPPNNPGWQVTAGTARITTPPCGESGKYAFSRGGSVQKFDSWTAAENARGTNAVTYYYEGATSGSAGPTSVPVAMDHWARLAQLDPTFRSQGLEAWLRTAGFTWTSLNADARQIEEETSPDSKIYASGIQVNVVGLSIPYPACMTTDKAVTAGSNTRMHQPDQRNPSKLWTEVPSFSGTATLWVDCSNWGQLNPGGAPPVGPTSVPPTTAPPATYTPQPTYTPLPTNTPYPTALAPTQTPVPSVPTATPTRVPAGPAGPTIPFPWEWVLGGLGALLLLALIVIGIVLLVRRLRTTPPPPPPVALNITTAAMLPNAPVGPGWVQALTAAGGTAPYLNWRLGVGRPAWLNIDANTGQLSGTTVAGDFLFQVSVDDSAAPAHSVTKAFQLHVA